MDSFHYNPTPELPKQSVRANSLSLPIDELLRAHSAALLPRPRLPAAQAFTYTDKSKIAPTQNRARTPSTSIPSGLTGGASANILSDTPMNPYALRHGRRYLRDQTLPYPLPCDLPELHRQNLRIILLTSIFGAPFCSPYIESKPPKKVLEVACGTALWSSAFHDYFSQLGYSDISFTGLDIAPLAPDLKEQGMNWKFVQYDLRKGPLPFEDEEFDLVFANNLSLVAPAGAPLVTLLEEHLRVLKKGGVLEAWDSDHTFRAILPHPPLSPEVTKEAQEQADATATFTIYSGTPFVAAQNRYLQDYNDWIQKALLTRKMTAVPCSTIGSMFLQETDDLRNVGNRRIAIPFGEVSWEREGIGSHHTHSNDTAILGGASKIATSPKGKRSRESRILTADQAAVRQTALLTVLQMIESLEPLLKEASGKSQDEWNRWWAAMMTALSKGTNTGECLEVGSWWGLKC